jgi:DNA polymerase-3 subunit epsilon
MVHGATDTPVVFIDVETTGLSPHTGARVIEVGALRMEKGIIVKKLNTLIYPECDVPDVITRITGISNKHVASAPVFSEIAHQLDDIMQGAIFVAHNVNFDYSFISAEYRRLSKTLHMPKLCTVQLSKALFPSQRSHKLEHVIAKHNYKVRARHRAYDDAEVLYRFVTDMLASDFVRTQQAIQRLLITT